MKNKIPELLQHLISMNDGLEKFKGHSWIIGGFVRDKIMKRESNDIDIVVDVQGGSKTFCNNLKSILGESVTEPFQLGNYPIWSVKFNKDVITIDNKEFDVFSEIVEISETQSESFPDDNSRQRITEFGTIEEDILRRDFVINQFRMDIETLKIIEPFPGAICKFGLKQKTPLISINPMVDVEEIFSQDPLRIIRALRFFVQLNGELTKEVEDGILKVADRLKIISQERILKELRKVCEVEGGLYKFMKLADKLDLIGILFPEIEKQKKIVQGPDIRNIHMESNYLFGHTMAVLKHTKAGFLNGMISLFHDIGKNESCFEKKTSLKTDGSLKGFCYSYNNHEKVGAELSIDILKRMKISSDEAKIITLIIREHMSFCMIDRNGRKKKAIRKLLRKLETKENLELLTSITRADSHGTLSMREDGIIVPTFDCSCLIKPLIEEVMNEEPTAKKSELLSGHKIMEILHIQPGKQIGEVKEFVKDLEDEYGTELTKEMAIEKVLQHFLKKD